MKTTKALLLFTGTVCVFATAAARAGQDVQVSTGYFDLTQAQFPAGLPTPSPWYGSPDTTFYGNVASATSSDPDEDAILLQNLGSSPVTLSAANFGGAYDLFSLDGVSTAIIFDSALWWHELILPSFNLCVNRELDETMGDPFDQPVHHLHQVQQIQRQRTT